MRAGVGAQLASGSRPPSARRRPLPRFVDPGGCLYTWCRARVLGHGSTTPASARVRRLSDCHRAIAPRGTGRAFRGARYFANPFSMAHRGRRRGPSFAWHPDGLFGHHGDRSANDDDRCKRPPPTTTTPPAVCPDGHLIVRAVCGGVERATGFPKSARASARAMAEELALGEPSQRGRGRVVAELATAGVQVVCVEAR